MRRKKEVTITFEGRDKGKVFVLTEMSAVDAEEWALRAFLALGNAGIELPDDMRNAGMAAIALVGLRALMRTKFDDVKPLMDQLMRCVEITPDPAKPFPRKLILDGMEHDDVQETSTLLLLKSEVFELMTGFSLAGAISQSLTPAALADPNTDPTQISQ